MTFNRDAIGISNLNLHRVNRIHSALKPHYSGKLELRKIQFTFEKQKEKKNSVNTNMSSVPILVQQGRG